MHATHQKILDYIKLYVPSIKMTEYLTLLDSAISNIEFVDVYPLTKELITITNTVLPTPLEHEFVLVKRIYATTATTLDGVDTATNKIIKQYEIEQNAVWIHSIGNYVIEYYYRPTILDENTDPEITDSYIPSIAEYMLYLIMIPVDANKAMVFLQNSTLHAQKAHLKESKKQAHSNLKPLWGVT